MKSSGDRISDLESRLFRVFSLRFCAFTSQDARHRELPTHGSAQQYWTIKARWIHSHSVSYTYQVSVHTVKSYPIDIAISCGATYWIASKQKPFAGRPQPCTWIQCLQGQPPSAATLCASIHLGQWRDSTFHGPTAADFVIGLWKLEPCQAHKHRILRDNFCALRVFKQTISQASQTESNAMLLNSMQAKDAASVIWFGSVESFSHWKFHSKRKLTISRTICQKSHFHSCKMSDVHSWIWKDSAYLPSHPQPLFLQQVLKLEPTINCT